MNKLDRQDLTPPEKRLTRLELGEAWMWCRDCMAKLYSFDGSQDNTISCPHPKKCEEERKYK